MVHEFEYMKKEITTWKQKQECLMSSPLDTHYSLF